MIARIVVVPWRLPLGRTAPRPSQAARAPRTARSRRRRGPDRLLQHVLRLFQQAGAELVVVGGVESPGGGLQSLNGKLQRQLSASAGCTSTTSKSKCCRCAVTRSDARRSESRTWPPQQIAFADQAIKGKADHRDSRRTGRGVPATAKFCSTPSNWNLRKASRRDRQDAALGFQRDVGGARRHVGTRHRLNRHVVDVRTPAGRHADGQGRANIVAAGGR